MSFRMALDIAHLGIVRTERDERGQQERWPRTEQRDAAATRLMSMLMGSRPIDAPYVIDPVCGMTVDPRDRQHRHRTLWARPITSARRAAATKFVADPARYLASEGRRSREAPCRKARSTPARCTREIRQVARALPDLRHGAGTAGRDAETARTPNSST